jgi:hypothetical protein
MAKKEPGKKNTALYKNLILNNNLLLTAAAAENKSPGILNSRRFLYSKSAL